jgi:hypothetical protein
LTRSRRRGCCGPTGRASTPTTLSVRARNSWGVCAHDCVCVRVYAFVCINTILTKLGAAMMIPRPQRSLSSSKHTH